MPSRCEPGGLESAPVTRAGAAAEAANARVPSLENHAARAIPRPQRKRKAMTPITHPDGSRRNPKARRERRSAPLQSSRAREGAIKINAEKRLVGTVVPSRCEPGGLESAPVTRAGAAAEAANARVPSLENHAARAIPRPQRKRKAMTPITHPDGSPATPKHRDSGDLRRSSPRAREKAPLRSTPNAAITVKSPSRVASNPTP